jgi:hypothetical protein
VQERDAACRGRPCMASSAAGLCARRIPMLEPAPSSACGRRTPPR